MSWLMLLIIIILKVFLLLPPSSPSLNLRPDRMLLPSLNRSAILQDGIPGTCYDSNISYPYPFGIPGVSPHEPKDGFEISCDLSTSGKPTYTVRLGQDNFTVLNISLDGQIRVSFKALASRCSTPPRRKANSQANSMEESQVPGQVAVPDLHGTPYTFSHSSNKLTVMGCDALALLQAPGRNAPTGCTSFCFSIDSLIEGSCSGVGCCQAPIPPGLKNFNLEFKSIRNITGAALNHRISEPSLAHNTTQIMPHNVTPGSADYGDCSKAFILDPANFTFSKGQLNRDAIQDMMELVLDWYIDNKTCEQASKATDHSFACVAENSSCYDVSGFGYRCNCSRGYQGNPYLKDRCIDIDECSTGEHDCAHHCKNTIGSYECRCPFGTRGDGHGRDGSGCKREGPLDIGLGAGLGFLIILFITSFLLYWAFKKIKIRRLKQRHFQQNGGLLLQQHISSRVATFRIFTEEELEFAANGFHESRVIGRGGYGTVYKGILSDGRTVAIKRSKQVDESQIEQFINEVVILSQINHKNVVKILGCCLETQVPLLVYQFISNGTLFHHLHTVKGSAASPILNWETRLRIAVETAAALAYLHVVASIPIIHRDVKSANILLDENYTAKVADFGASRLVPCNRTHVTTLVQGTLGYLDPEYFHTSLLTEKSDVYSFGVVLVELLTRENPVSFCRSDEEKNLAFYFISLKDQNRLIERLDKETVEEAGTRQLLEVAQLAKRCLNIRGEERPTMREVAVELEALRRLMHHHFVQEGKVHQTSPSTSLMINDTALPDSMESILLSGPSV